VPLADGLLIVAIGAAFFAIIEVEKQLRLSLSSAATGTAGNRLS